MNLILISMGVLGVTALLAAILLYVVSLFFYEVVKLILNFVKCLIQSVLNKLVVSSSVVTIVFECEVIPDSPN